MTASITTPNHLLSDDEKKDVRVIRVPYQYNDPNDKNNNNNNNNEKEKDKQPDEIQYLEYVINKSTLPMKVNEKRISSIKENETLNLYLGRPDLFTIQQNPLIRLIQSILYILLDCILGLPYYENYIFLFFNEILPISWQRSIILYLYTVWYVPIHKKYLGTRTGIHPYALSYEYHALTTMLYWTRYLPLTIHRIRYAVSQVTVVTAEIVVVIEKTVVPNLQNEEEETETKENEKEKHDQPKKIFTAFNNTHTSKKNNKMMAERNGTMSSSFRWLSSPTIFNTNTTTTTKTHFGTTTKKTKITSTGAILEKIKVNVTDLFIRNHIPIPSIQQNACIVSGILLQRPISSTTSKHHHDHHHKKVIYWLCGGAFMAGDCYANLQPADNLAYQCSSSSTDKSSNKNNDNTGTDVLYDVFLPNQRLAPESTMNDLLWDIVLAYKYLIEVEQYQPKNVLLLGVSSGGALCLRLMQYILEYHNQQSQQSQHQHQNGDSICNGDKQPSPSSSFPTTTKFLPDYIEPLFSIPFGTDSTPTQHNGYENHHDVSYRITEMPSGCVLVGPFVDFTVPPPFDGSLVQYSEHDLIVNPNILSYSLPYLQTHMNGKPEYQSPFYHPIQNSLPPICVVVSEHEVVYDMTIQLVNVLRQNNVQVTVGIWKYVCHMFPFFQDLIPEGKHAMEFIRHWICNNNNNNNHNNKKSTKTKTKMKNPEKKQ